MWDVTRHWISVAKPIFSSENIQTAGTFFYLIGRGRRHRIIAYVTTFEWEKMLFSPTFSNDLQRCKVEGRLKSSS